MAHLDAVSKDYLVSVAAEIGKFIDSGFSDSPATASDAGKEDTTGLEIAETIAVMKLRDRAFEAMAATTPAGDLSEWIEEKPLSLHHQIRLRGKAEGFARSDPKAPTGERVLDISSSEFAEALNQCFEILEENRDRDRFIDQDPIVRLLEIPPYQVFALWLFNEPEVASRVLIVDAPEGYSELSGRVLDSETFFAALKTNGPLLGLA